MADVTTLVDQQTNQAFIIPTLVLSEDNKRILNANIVAHGHILKDKARNVDGSKLWDTTLPLNVKLANIELRKFVFNGELCSELIDAKLLGTLEIFCLSIGKTRVGGGTFSLIINKIKVKNENTLGLDIDFMPLLSLNFCGLLGSDIEY